MRHQLTKVSVNTYPVLSVEFDDGIAGDVDMSEDIATKPMFAELQVPAFFGSVSIGRDGSCLGWKLDDLGNEIDLSADGLRNDIEVQIVRARAARYRASSQAAE
jgi:Protein of unknown function (DUF2442)